MHVIRRRSVALNQRRLIQEFCSLSSMDFNSQSMSSLYWRFVWFIDGISLQEKLISSFPVQIHTVSNPKCIPFLTGRLWFYYDSLMKLKVCKKSILALSCAVQIILLSLSAISPDIHSRICHGEHEVSFQETYCEDHRSHDGDLPSPQHSPTHEDHTCPVSLFATGIVSLLVSQPQKSLYWIGLIDNFVQMSSL